MMIESLLAYFTIEKSMYQCVFLHHFAFSVKKKIAAFA